MDVLALLRERILAFAASRYGRQIAEDITQEVLLVLHQKYPHVSALNELVPLALQIARFKLTAWSRKVHRRGEHEFVDIDAAPLPDPQIDIIHDLEHKDLIHRLELALPQLGERCREIFRLKLSGLSFPEIQQQLGAASINTVYTWESRCRQDLKRLMEGRLN